MVHGLVDRARGLEYGGREFESRAALSDIRSDTKLMCALYKLLNQK